MSSVTNTFDPEAFIRKARAAAEQSMAVGGEVIRNAMKVNLSGHSPSTPGNFPGADTGTLSRSIYNEHSGPLQRTIGTRLAYGKYLETGATIRPVRVKAIPVPLNYAAKRMLKTLNVVGGSNASLRSKNLVRVGSLLIERTAGGKPSKSANAARFALRKSVRLLARPWCFRSAVGARSEALAAVGRDFTARLQGVAQNVRAT